MTEQEKVKWIQGGSKGAISKQTAKHKVDERLRTTVQGMWERAAEHAV